MATNEKVDVVIVGAGASGSVYASVLAKAGKKVVLLDNGPDWQLHDLISSEIWGRRIKPAGAPVPARRQESVRLRRRRPAGASAARRCTISPTYPRFLPNDYKIKSEHNRALDWPISYRRCRAVLRQGRGTTSACPATPRRRRSGGRRAKPYPMPPMKTFRQRRSLGRRASRRNGIRMVPARGRHELDRIQGPAGLHL